MAYITEEDIVKRFQEHEVRPTAMRLLVYRTLMQSRYAMSLKELEEKLVTAERSTIFRSLSLLLEHHLLHAIEDGSGSTRYEVCTGRHRCTLKDQHIHFFCERCQRTFCLHDIHVPDIALPEGFYAHTVNFMIKGFCPQCAAKG